MNPQHPFPPGFIWGSATAGHQIEGQNVNSDFWQLENTAGTIFKEPSNDACDSWQRWHYDLDLVRRIGLGCYRFSIEWSRIEPEPGLFSRVALDHYKAVIAGCRDRGILPFVTFNHWTVPRWFAARGGWTNPESPALFARYCDRAVRHLGAEIAYAATLNEPNGLLIAQQLVPPQAIAAQRAMLATASRNSGVEDYVGGPFFSHISAALPQMLAAHAQGRAAIKASRPDLPVGATLAVLDDQADGDPARRDAMRQAFYGAWLDAVKGDEFVGIQNYIRIVWGADGQMPLPADAIVNQEGLEIYPPSLAHCARYVHQATGVPIFVTEHGVMTQDDSLRERVIPLALAELQQTIAQGVPVIGYLHWSLIDNFEWVHGYGPRYGLASVDPQTFERHLKPSASVLGAIARNNAV